MNTFLRMYFLFEVLRINKTVSVSVT